MKWESTEEESKANVAQWRQKCDNCEKSPGRRKDEFLEYWRWFIHFLLEWKRGVSSEHLDRFWTCIQTLYFPFLLTVSCPSLCPSYASLLALVADICSYVMLENFSMGNVYGLSEVSGELLLESVPVINVTQGAALLPGSKT